MNERLELYKEFYFREIDRKSHINNGINIPILVISVIISIHLFLFTQNLKDWVFIAGIILSTINLVCILFSIFYLSKSFSNLLSTHIYRELSDMQSLREYEVDLINEQDKISDAKYLFDKYLINEFTLSAKHNFLVNKSRTEDLAKSKTIIFMSLILTIFFSILFIVTLI